MDITGMDITARNYHDNWVTIEVRGTSTILEENIMSAAEARALSDSLLAVAYDLLMFSVGKEKERQ